MSNNYLNEQISPPDYLTGDLDSCTANTQKVLAKLGCKICVTKDQDETDFTKSLMTLQSVFQEKNVCGSFSTILSQKDEALIFRISFDFQIDNIITVLDFSGRIDHILSQINTLHKAVNFLDCINLFLLTKNSLSWLLQPGQHRIHIPERFVAEELWCSHVPVGSRCRVTTSGLKWDLGEFESK